MLHSFRDTLKKIPHDQMLLEFLGRNGYTPSMADEFDGKLNASRADSMTLEIHELEDADKREALISELQELLKFDNPKAEEELLSTINLLPREDDEYPDDPAHTVMQRAMWLYLRNPISYQHVSMKLDMLARYHYCQRFRYRRFPKLHKDEASRLAFRDELQDYFTKKLKFKVFLEVDIWECGPGIYCIMCRVQDLPRTLQVVSREKIDTIMFSPVRPVAIQYSEATGCADMLISGGEKAITMLKTAFARHLLHNDAEPDDARNPMVHLDWLREEEFFSQLAVDDGFTVMRTRSITMTDPAGKMRMTAECHGRDNMESSTDYSFDGDPEGIGIFDLLPGWDITSAEFQFIYGGPGKFRGKYKKLTVTVKANGSTNLTSYPASIRERILRYLVDGFIMEMSD